MASLSGLDAIAAYLKKSKNTTLDLIRNENFPAVKMRGTWESDTALIDKWRIWFILKQHGATDQKLDLYNDLIRCLSSPAAPSDKKIHPCVNK